MRRFAPAPIAAGLLLAVAAGAHPLAPALLSLAEGEDGVVEVAWKLPLARSGGDPQPALPSHCAPLPGGEREQEGTGVVLRYRVDCGARGLVGASVGVTGLMGSGGNALLRVALRDGRRMQAVLHAGAPEFRVPERQTAWGVVAGYGRLGCEHILTGLDHLVFVLGLLLLVGGGRRLVYTVTAFTLGHSVTLSLATLGFVRFPSAPVELVIAGTILLLALELASPPRERPSWMRRAPWLMAGSFGLLHGLGFAGALSEVGLPAGEIPLALLAFNAGIEVGQLAFVAVALGVGRAIAAVRSPLPGLARSLPAHAMGGLAVYWCLDRAAGMLGVG